MLFQQTNYLFRSISILVMIVLIVENVRGCFITNCPPAGKRSMLAAIGSSTQTRRECIRCGPGLSGRCYGPSICCSPLFGCNVGGFASSRCALEAFNPMLCSNPGSACGPNGKGICAINSTCCTDSKI
ncbi:vasopressin-like protein [Sarcoptes scabiei]|uniref:Vasopressin-like protein n=2 Tax=Sarcoptes scabiei TaxID=52283 RepID=A0A131ZV02_SARSC|nr:vasopressin-like protein [Sarcoptes scabiei]